MVRKQVGLLRYHFGPLNEAVVGGNENAVHGVIPDFRGVVAHVRIELLHFSE